MWVIVLISNCYSHNSNVITSFAETHTYTHTHTHKYTCFLIKNCVCCKGHRISRFINFCFINNVISSFMYAGDNRNVFNIHGSVHCKNILIYIQQDATLHSLFYMETALHVSGGTTTHHQERKQLYLQHLVFVTLCWNCFECAVHTQNSSNSSTTVAGSSNGVTNTICCRYSCLCSWWWVEVPSETCTAVSR